MKTHATLAAILAVALPSVAHAGGGSGSSQGSDASHGASAGSARIEGRVGIMWADHEEAALVGLATGYDFHVGDSAFVGVEAAAEKPLTDHGFVEFSLSGRLGVRVSHDGALFAVGGYTHSEAHGAPHAGVGYEHHLSDNGLYAAVEYRHMFVEGHPADTVAIGLGMMF